MTNYYLSISIRYISLTMIFVLCFNSITIDVLSLISLFLFTINNQVRFFIINKNKIGKAASLLIELFLALFLIYKFDVFSIFLFAPLIIDTSLLFTGKFKYYFLCFLIFIPFFIGTISFYEALEATFVLLSVSLLCCYIYNENCSKLNSQILYDKLRISEDKLKKANDELEIYISSVEELTLLKERNRIAREIHDSVGHTLSTTIIQLGALENLSKEYNDIYPFICNLKDFIKESYSEVRASVSSLKPKNYENYQNLFKIRELINNFSTLTNIDVKLTISKNTWELSKTQSMVLYRVIQESLSNALRHGHATTIKIFITFNTLDLIVTIIDNGVGCNKIINGNGIKSITERIHEVNGSVDFKNHDDGFTVQASFPRKKEGVFIE